MSQKKKIIDVKIQKKSEPEIDEPARERRCGRDTTKKTAENRTYSNRNHFLG